MKDELCRAFCNEITVKDVPAGLAVSTPFRRSDGDAVSFYVVRDAALPGFARIEDDGQTIPYLEACGVDFETQTRVKALEALLKEYGAELDEAKSLIHTPNMREAELPRVALRFVALLLRLSDFLLLREKNTSKAHSRKMPQKIRETIGDRATIDRDQLVSERLTEIVPDLVIRAENRDPVAVFFAQSAPRVFYDAIILQMAALYEAKQPLSVIALLEAESSDV